MTSLRGTYEPLLTVVAVLLAVAALVLALAVRIIKQYEQGVLFRFGRVVGPRQPGLPVIIPFVDVSAVAYFRVVEATRSAVAIENVYAAIDQIAQTTLRKEVGQHSLDETLSETDAINIEIPKILDVTTDVWGVQVTLVELKDIQLPDTMKRAMARQAEAERESLAAEALGVASDIMVAHPLALQMLFQGAETPGEIACAKRTRQAAAA